VTPSGRARPLQPALTATVGLSQHRLAAAFYLCVDRGYVDPGEGLRYRPVIRLAELGRWNIAPLVTMVRLPVDRGWKGLRPRPTAKRLEALAQRHAGAPLTRSHPSCGPG
jgi:hypothetical protein